MKKFFIFLLAAGLLSFSSCSKDDDETENKFSIIGTWQLEDMNPSTAYINSDACSTKPKISFNDDGTAQWTFYREENNCEGQTDSGTWEQQTARQYAITIPGWGTFEGTVEIIDSKSFAFHTSFDTMPVVLTFSEF